MIKFTRGRFSSARPHPHDVHLENNKLNREKTRKEVIKDFFAMHVEIIEGREEILAKGIQGKWE